MWPGNISQFPVGLGVYKEGLWNDRLSSRVRDNAGSTTMSFASSLQQRNSTLKTIRSLIDCLVNIKDEQGEFLMPLKDGRVIDTKGWNDWEVRGVPSEPPPAC